MSNVPKLRFKEFSGEWEEKTLGEISSKVLYGIGSSAIAYDGVNKYLRITDIDESSRTFIPNPLTSPGGDIEEKYKLVVGDLVFARTGASTGKSYLYNEKDGNLIYAGFLIKFHIDKANPYFVYANTFKEQYYKWVQIMSMRSGQPGINAEEYKLLPLFLPSKKEQEKIASFLTSIDTKIEQLIKKEELLKQYKKGVMQKIFNQEIRFKADDGSEFCEWEEKKLGELFIYRNGGSFESDVIEDGQYNLITLNSIDINGELKLEHKRVNINDNSLSKNDLIMVLSDVAHGNFLGLTAIIPEDNVYVLNQRMGALKPKTNNNISFIRFYINFNQKYFKLHGQGSSQQNLSKGDIEKFIVNIPCLSEQTKIANFLSSIDSKIEQVQKQLNSAKEFKKALLQQMFV